MGRNFFVDAMAIVVVTALFGVAVESRLRHDGNEPVPVPAVATPAATARTDRLWAVEWERLTAPPRLDATRAARDYLRAVRARESAELLDARAAEQARFLAAVESDRLASARSACHACYAAKSLGKMMMASRRPPEVIVGSFINSFASQMWVAASMDAGIIPQNPAAAAAAGFIMGM